MVALSTRFNPDDHLEPAAMTCDPPNLAAALRHAEAGIPVFPALVSPGETSWNKRPAIAGWQAGASIDPERIRAWWRQFPHALPGIELGRAGLVVIDADRHGDGPDGIAALAELAALHGGLPVGPIVETAGGGLHYVFRNVPADPLGNSPGALPAGVDVRGAGGWIVAPGAVRSDGAAYREVDGAPSLAEAFAEDGAGDELPTIPAWLAEIIRRPKAPAKPETWRAPARPVAAPATVGDRERRYAAKALAAEAAKLASVTSGRNSALNAAAVKVGHYVGAGWIGEAEASDALAEAATANGYVAKDGSRAMLATLASGLRAGMAEPAAPLPDRIDDDAEFGAAIVAGLKRGERIDPKTAEANAGEGRPLRSEGASAPEALFDPWEAYIVPSFPLDVLPPAIRGFVEEKAVHLGTCRSALAMAALGACSGAIDHRWKLRPRQHGEWSVSPRLWVLLVGDPSRGKTPAINAALAPIEAEEAARRQAYLNAVGEHERAPVTSPEPEKPDRLVVGDVTVEKLGEILSRQSRGVLVKRDEIAGWVGAMEKYSGGRGSAVDRAFWLQAYNGGTFTVDRQTRGELYVSNLSVSLIGGIQPARLAQLRDLEADGLLQRFLPVMMAARTYPEDRPFHRDGDPYGRLVTALLHVHPEWSASGPVPLKVHADGARIVEALMRHLFDLEQVADVYAAGFQAFVGKLGGVFGSLALVLHLAHHPEAPPSYVPADIVEKAARIIREFIIPHAQEFYRTAATVTDGDRTAKVASWILTSGKTQFVPSDFVRNVAHFKNLGVWEVNKALSPLVAGGWLVPAEVGPLARKWTLSPAVPVFFAARAAEEDRRKAVLADLMRSPRKR
ncbi:DUF3987 domain-containing protein [Oharaeibacter diazotrophicus]|uniref:Uncharacterized protein DUF3987 n=1 Tax=Oharaeibacter diazotrophicus TaxID=1920512 RepID=A0A4R6RH60_9HYPH|nr:DUF3987 domain-containing protein [Oharaeibacter diazotrophicus]TDP85604.1 uncharacterized protein DUF3987 [Oharaeibacter diazotrophicus]BBE74572.1 hypothetical protein OHA_1_04204 [Pleomorphomonas sp. SM30]GLS75725.1 hypothetical protein GCM10007904_10600 [Oharaeibacter diazotrophicus]